MTSTKDDFNPFEDPSVKNLTEQSAVNQDSVEAYNPFDQSRTTKQIVASERDSSVNNPSSNSAVHSPEMQQPAQNPPPYSQAAGESALTSDLQRRQEIWDEEIFVDTNEIQLIRTLFLGMLDELERKANELQAREARLVSSPAAGSGKNWPPLPAKCCVGPCFYQDISVEIPNAYQRTVRLMYYLWIFYSFLLFLNMLGALALFIANGEGSTFGISILIFFLFSPMSFVCWFRPLYKAFRSDSSFNFMVFFFVFFFQFIVAVIYAVGIPKMGACGLLNGITMLSQGGEHTVSVYTVGIIVIFIGFLWAIDAMVSFYMLVKIHRMYRGTTASFAKAQEELASGVMRNPHVQNAAATAATQAAQQTFNSAASGLRY